jgi:hypothetical protein
MHELTVSVEQAQFIAQAHGPLVVVDLQGHLLGHLTPANGVDCRVGLSDDELAEIKRRMQSTLPGLSTEQVLGYLDSLKTA